MFARSWIYRVVAFLLVVVSANFLRAEDQSFHFLGNLAQGSEQIHACAENNNISGIALGTASLLQNSRSKIATPQDRADDQEQYERTKDDTKLVLEEEPVLEILINQFGLEHSNSAFYISSIFSRRSERSPPVYLS